MNVVALPWPNRLLSPNARVHHMLKGRATRSNRAVSSILGSACSRKRLRTPVLAILPIVTTRRRRDIDNVLAGLKSALDGLTDAGWWGDDSEIAGITVRKPLYCKAWGRDPIVLVADEECNEDVMIRRLREFAAHAASDPDGSWMTLCS